MASFVDLPSELLVYILQEWLKSTKDIVCLDIACTSHHMRNAYLSTVRRALSSPMAMLYPRDPANNANSIRWHLARAPGVSSMHVYLHQLHDLMLHPIAAASIHMLQLFEIKGNTKKIDNKMFRKFINCYPKLKDIRIKNCDSIKAGHLDVLASMHTSIALERVDISGCNHVADDALCKLAIAHSKSLKHFGTIITTEDTLVELVAHCTLLTMLNILPESSICIDMLLDACASLEYLEDLSIAHHLELNDSHISSILQSNPKLQRLDCFNSCPNVTHHSLIKVLTSFPHITTCKMSGCSYVHPGLNLAKSSVDLSLPILQACPALQSLHIYTLDDMDLAKCIAALFGKSLVLLTASGKHTNSLALEYLLAHLPCLQRLSLQLKDCSLTNNGQTLCSQLNQCTELRELALYNYDALDDADAIALVQALPRLEKINMGGYTCLSEETMQYLQTVMQSRSSAVATV